MSAVPLARRDRKKAETREALRSAALRLSVEHGYDLLTVEAITEAADVSVRTFFNYFGSKDDALLAPDPDQAEALAAGIAARPAGEHPVASLRAVFGELADSFAESGSMWQARMDVVRTNPQLWPRLFARLTDLETSVTEAVAARTGTDPHTDLYPGVVATAAVGALRVAIGQWRAGRQSAPLSELISKAFDVLAAGLDAPVVPAPHR